MQRYLWCLALLFLIWLAGTGSADAAINDPASNDLSWREMARRLELEEMEKFKTSIDEEISGYLANGSVQEWLADFISGKWKFDLAEIGSSIWRFFIGEIMANGHLLGKILILAVVSALLVNLQSSFGEGVAKISSMACFLAISAIALGSFKYVMQIGQTAIDSMSGFMTAILPQMMILVTGLGHLHTATTVFPIMMVACTAFAKGIEWIIFPLITLSAVLNVTNCISDTISLERLGKLVYTAAEIILGLMLTCFIGILTLRSIYGSVMDALTLKTGKFVTDTFFPVIGGYLSDALETAAGYVVLLKQAVGILGILLILGIVIFPVLKIGVIALIYKVSAAMIEPLGDIRISKVLEIMGNHLFLALATVAAVGLMFLVLVAILVSTGNSVILLR